MFGFLWQVRELRALLSGWRPSRPQHRGGQCPVSEPGVALASLQENGDFTSQAELPTSSSSFAASPEPVPKTLFFPTPDSSGRCETQDAGAPDLGKHDRDASPGSSLWEVEEFEFLLAKSGIVRVQASAEAKRAKRSEGPTKKQAVAPLYAKRG